MLKLSILIVITVVLSSCKGLSQPDDVSETTEELTFGKEIDQLNEGVARIFQDSQNNYWFSHEGIVKYDGEKLIQYSTEDGLYANGVHDIQEDHLGNLYFDTGEGVNKFDGKSIEKLVAIEDQSKAKGLNPTDLWFAGDWNMNGVYRYDGQHLYHLTLPKHELEKEFEELNPQATFDFYSNYTTFKDSNGIPWFGGAIFGACRFDGSEFFWVSEREMTEMDPGPSMGIRSIVRDNNDDFYFASNVNSKYRVYNKDGQTTYEKLRGIDNSKEPRVKSSCISMTMDNQGNFWMAHYEGGVWKYDGESFTHYPILIKSAEAQVFSIYKDKSGGIWLGTHNAGAWKFNGKDFVRFLPEIPKN
ncbi:MAG: two-component regulator propeller domain-containing protein [Crocinitomicaceae bacterium]|nr:two-component regulator propeller domain-containing protein [Crocinitomicaceae bacterium]